MMNLIKAAVTAALLFAPEISLAQQGTYAKAQLIWFQQGKISGGISVGSSSAATALPSAGQTAWICNTGSADSYLAFGPTNAVVATSTGSTWLKAGACGGYDLNAFTLPSKFVAAISPTSTTLTIETGIGTPPSGGASSGGGGGGAVTIADGADTAEGLTTDPTIAAGATGTVSSKLRLMTSQLDALLTSGTSQIPAGTNVIGKVGGDGTAAAPSVNTLTVQGGQADAAVAAGNALAVAGIFQTTAPTYTDGQRAALHTDARGNLAATLYAAASNQPLLAAPSTSTAVGTNGAANTLDTNSLMRIFNGSAWDAGFTCPNTAAVNVTAGSTTQIVALSGTTTIRVCSITVSMSAAGTFGILSGTGTNCATPAGATTPMTLATGAPINAVAPAGGSIYRSTAGGEICIAAATGNVTGWITYVQF